jgi:hypothetical protein
MARPASELLNNPFLRVLLMSAAKVGKSTVAITTAPAPVRVILCEDDSALLPAKRITDKFSVSDARKLGKGAFDEMRNVLLEAKNDAKAGKIKTVVVDPFSEFAHHLLEESFEMNKTGGGADNGMVAYGEYGRRLDHALDYMFTIPCHLIVISHYASESPEISGQIKKQGDGIVPLIPGKMRNRMGGKFADILWMDIDPKDSDKRVFVTGPRGAWGPGCRHMHGAHVLPADFGELIKTFAAQDKPKPPTRPAAPLKPIAGGRR